MQIKRTEYYFFSMDRNTRNRRLEGMFIYISVMCGWLYFIIDFYNLCCYH
ncbi:hypothetical protein [Pectinatus sottacetonis]|nr:hypothetical protein [Pectinatus sottacetonis]